MISEFKSRPPDQRAVLCDPCYPSLMPRRRNRYVCPVCHSKCAWQRRMVEFIERSTRESGVPYHVEDPEAIRKVLVLLGVSKT